MREPTKSIRRYDLDERTFKFAKDVIEFTDSIPKTIANVEIIKQVVRSSGSVGANDIEANESLGPKDISMRMKICRKEAKESIYWLKLVQIKGEEVENKRQTLITEATELTKIFSTIVEKVNKSLP